MNAIEQQILNKLGTLAIDQQQRVLAFVEQIAAPNTELEGLPSQRLSATALMRLPPAERETILRAQLMALAEEDFETFEAYSEEDLDATP